MEELTFSVKKGSEPTELEAQYDLVILGAGPAGLTAAIYAARAKLKTLVVEKEVIGGEIASTDMVENYPGFPEGISGAVLAQRMEEQAKKFGAQIYQGVINRVELKRDAKMINLDGKKIKAISVIVATGTSPKLLGAPGEKEFKGKGVSYCATCDGPIFSGKDIAVIGCGNSGLQEGLFILKFVKSISFVEFLPTIQAEKILQDRIKEYENVKFYLNHQVLSINGDKTVQSITVKDRRSGQTKEIPVSGVFVYVGLIPNIDFLKGELKLNNWGYIIADERLQTSIPGVFVAGDVREKDIRQVATAIGDGAVTAASAGEYIERLKR